MSNDLSPRSRMSPERRAELFSVVRERLYEVGYERLTYDAVASQARTSKATLYRHWGSKSELVLAALTQEDARHPPMIQNAAITSLDDAFTQLASSGRLSDHNLRMGVMLLHAASSDPGFAADLRKEIIMPTVNELADIFEAAADRGEIARDSPLFARLAYVILTDLALFPLLNGRDDNQADREELLRTVIRPTLTFTGPNSP